MEIKDFAIIEFEMSKLEDLFFPSFKTVFDCIIIAEESQEVLEKYETAYRALGLATKKEEKISVLDELKKMTKIDRV